MSIRPEEDPGYFDEFANEDVRKELNKPKCAPKKDENPEAEAECFEERKNFVPPDEA